MSNKMALDALTPLTRDETEHGREYFDAAQVRAAIAALQAEPQGWRPIETAPKDVDVILTDGVNVSEGGWLSDIDAGADYEGQLGMAGWWAVAWPDEHGVKPTHWMPLPTPPKD